MIRFCASVTFAGRKIQISYRVPRELVRALRDLGSSAGSGLIVHRVYVSGKAPSDGSLSSPRS